MKRDKRVLKPHKETKKKMRPIAKSAFHNLLNKAAKTTVTEPVLKRAAKSA
jgi:hypothetical protein